MTAKDEPNETLEGLAQKAAKEHPHTAPPDGNDGMITLALAELPPDSAMPSPPPKASLIRSIKADGVLEPIRVVLVGNRYFVEAGVRRIKAAREAGLTTIPAIIVEDKAGRWRRVIATNENREPNPLGELEAIQQLLKKVSKDDAGQPKLEEIAAQTGMPIPRIRQRLALIEKLNPSLLDAARKGKIGLRIAQAAAKLDGASQERLLAKLTENEDAKKARLLTADDIHDVRQVAKVAATQMLPEFIIPKPTAAEIKGRLIPALATWLELLATSDAPPSVLKAVQKAHDAALAWEVPQAVPQAG